MPHSRPENIAIKLSRKVLIQLLPAHLVVYFLVFKKYQVNSIHERALRLIYNDYELPFDRLTSKKAIEIYKFQAALTPPTMSDLFATKKNN